MLRWVLLVLPALGGLISGIITCTGAPEAAGHGTDAALEACNPQVSSVEA